MEDLIAPPQNTQFKPLLRRRNSISTSIVVIPTKLTVIPNHSSSSSDTTSTTTSAATSSFTSDDLELLSIKSTGHSYTSLKDILPSIAVNSPKPNSPHQFQPGSDICIRNRLVKQAAWAYLQPMSETVDSTAGDFFHRLWPRVADFVRRSVVCVLGVICIRSSR